MFCIILADRPNGSCKLKFFKPGLRVKEFENAALAFSCWQWLFILCVTMTPSPHPLTSSLRPLNLVTSYNNNNNNNGWLHARVHAAEDIEPIRVTRAKYSAPLPLRWATKDYGQPHTPHRLFLVVLSFSFYCLFVYSMQALCTCSVSSSIWMQKFLKWCQGRWGKKRLFWYVLPWLKTRILVA